MSDPTDNHQGAYKIFFTADSQKNSESSNKELETKEVEMGDVEMGEAMTANGLQSKFVNKEKKVKIVLESLESSLRYKIQDNPPAMIILMGALQHILLSMSGCLSTSSVVADMACIPFDHPVRSHLFCTTIFMVGLCTIMQTALGIRLPIFQGPSSSFLVPLLALQRDPKWKCSHISQRNNCSESSDNNGTFVTNSTTYDATIDDGIQWRLQEMSGALILASLVEVIFGLTGLLKFMLHFIGPITIACTISLIGVSLYKLPIMYGRANFPVAIGCMSLVMIFVLYLNWVSIPLPKFGKNSKKKLRSRFPIFQLLPILLSVVIMWVITWILTAGGVFTDDKCDIAYMARADAKANIITSSKWFQITYPGQFGPPKISVALTLGFLVACFSSMIESVGDYYAAQKVCQTPQLPDHAISRGILVEGIGSILSALVGAGHATTSYSGNIAILTLTKTASRVVMYAAGAILLAVSLLGKAGAALTTIPNPILGGVLMVILGTLLSIGLANLKHVDMTSSRNLLVVGIPFMAGVVIPAGLDMYPTLIQTGNDEADRIINVVLGTPMFLGGLLALILDSTVPGSRESRGMAQWEERHEAETSTENQDVYSWSSYPRILRICPLLKFVPFMPKATGFYQVNKHDSYREEKVAS